jgi:hypothetical protein
MNARIPNLQGFPQMPQGFAGANTCPFCQKASDNPSVCSHCGGDIAWAKANNFDVSAGGKNFEINPQSNPAMQNLSERQWIKNSAMPDWIKAIALQNMEKK